MKTKFGILVLCIAGSMAMASPALAQCGPGSHWIDQCPAGIDELPDTTAFLGLDTDLDCQADTSVHLSGAAVVRHWGPADDSTNYPGTRSIDGHLDVLDTEIISMSLSGSGLTLVVGAGEGQGGVLGPSHGVHAELRSDDALAESFFEVLLELDLGGPLYVYNQAAIRFDAVIDRVPPLGATYVASGCYPLLHVTGGLMANLITAELIFDESSEVPALPSWGTLGLVVLLAGAGAWLVRWRIGSEKPGR